VLVRSGVAYDEKLADRILELLEDESGLQHKKMFGGVAFLIGGNLAIAARGQGGVLVRVGPAEADQLIRSSGAELAFMGTRRMRGWVRVAPEHHSTKRQLAKWVERGAACARSLPAKQQGSRLGAR
jgi:TfoX/Sxy family transcriptional regulator of competence genes